MGSGTENRNRRCCCVRAVAWVVLLECCCCCWLLDGVLGLKVAVRYSNRYLGTMYWYDSPLVEAVGVPNAVVGGSSSTALLHPAS